MANNNVSLLSPSFQWQKRREHQQTIKCRVVVVALSQHKLSVIVKVRVLQLREEKSQNGIKRRGKSKECTKTKTWRQLGFCRWEVIKCKLHTLANGHENTKAVVIEARNRINLPEELTHFVEQKRKNGKKTWTKHRDCQMKERSLLVDNFFGVTCKKVKNRSSVSKCVARQLSTNFSHLLC